MTKMVTEMTDEYLEAIGFAFNHQREFVRWSKELRRKTLQLRAFSGET